MQLRFGSCKFELSVLRVMHLTFDSTTSYDSCDGQKPPLQQGSQAATGPSDSDKSSWREKRVALGTDLFSEEHLPKLIVRLGTVAFNVEPLLADRIAHLGREVIANLRVRMTLWESVG